MNKFSRAAEILNAKYGTAETEESVRLFVSMGDDEAVADCTAEGLAVEMAEYSGLRLEQGA